MRKNDDSEMMVRLNCNYYMTERSQIFLSLSVERLGVHLELPNIAGWEIIIEQFNFFWTKKNG